MLTFQWERNLVLDSLRGEKRGRIKELLSIPDDRIERGEFIKRTAVFTVAALIACAFGSLAGCGGDTTTVERQAASVQIQNQGTARDQGATQSQGGATTQNPSDQGQGYAPSQSGVADCRFYNNGTCEKTGQSCTRCTER